MPKKITKKQEKLHIMLKFLKIYGIIILGAFLTACGVTLFLSPAKVTSGGLSGVGIILNGLFGLPIGLFMLVANIPVFLVGTKFIGKEFLIRSLAGTVLFSVFTDLTAFFKPITSDLLLSSIAGGVLLGTGIGLILLAGASTGGTDILARVFNKTFPSVDVGKFVFIIDTIVIACSGIVFKNWDLSLYGLIALFINSAIIDYFLQGANAAKTAFIISEHSDEIALALLGNMKRGVSGIEITGMYKKTQKLMLMCIMKKYEITELKKIVLSIDENAFIIFMGANEVSGEGFKIYPIN